ncbi:MAG: transketolase [Alphaproteobacteria bacterium]|nr:transketolase [Alphaproteobacteria bacterium]
MSSPGPLLQATAPDARKLSFRGEHLRRLSVLARYALEIRRLALVGIYHAGSGHPGGSLSCADILAALYGAELAIVPGEESDPHRDRFVLSKGHAAPALYAAWAACGYIEKEAVRSLRKLASPYQGHPHVKDTPLAETSTGSLGQGFSVAIGMALGLRHLKSPARVYTLLGDGELQEGQVWEGAMFAAHRGLGNLLAIIDYNKMQSDDLNANILGLEPLAEKWRAFGWNVQEIDGHDLSAILEAFQRASQATGQPSVIIAHTRKGRGVAFMEGKPAWHGSVKLKDAEIQTALAGLGLGESEIGSYLNGSIG